MRRIAPALMPISAALANPKPQVRRATQSHQNRATHRVASSRVAQAADQPWRSRVRNGARGRITPSNLPRICIPKISAVTKRNDHVVATKTDAENRGGRVEGYATSSEEQQRDACSDKQVREQHDILFGKPICKPADQ